MQFFKMKFRANPNPNSKNDRLHFLLISVSFQFFYAIRTKTPCISTRAKFPQKNKNEEKLCGK